VGALDQRPRDCHDTRWPLHTLALGGVHVDYKGSLVGYKEGRGTGERRQRVATSEAD